MVLVAKRIERTGAKPGRIGQVDQRNWGAQPLPDISFHAFKGGKPVAGAGSAGGMVVCFGAAACRCLVGQQEKRQGLLKVL
ncbi:MAG: hypothetical protein GX086_12935 [Alcaligenaceae bacterium]|nr:hypothetical protein [Alcaligenaceae bacterium]